ncbi:MAG TPA: pseudouridine-5'-phosphate glycosidase, partial [Longimicrobiaceae bacterium]|nr:pseudouridine-5'-phosphate glycosidase [Longimicrobiaceae bacterium]
MLQLSPEVRAALDGGRPVVALESTVLAHGLPRPRNLEVGLALEAEVRGGGATPATVGVLGGVPRVGLSAAEVERMATAEGVLKLSTRDLPVALARGADGATTVAATMWLARAAGVQVFATGGIGGVHRGDGRDVSADLAELGRTPLVVVCAGAKAILDLPATREALETAGVLVVGWRTAELPAFYSAESGLGVDVRAEGAAAVAELWRAHRALGLPGALLLCVPPPAEHALPGAEVDAAIGRALRRAEERGVRGKEVTPFLLRAVAEETGGRSLEANVALLRGNARVAAEVAATI